MDRIEFSNKLVKARENAGCGKNEMCRRTGFTFVQLQRIEQAANSYNMSLPLKYLNAINYHICVSDNGQQYKITSNDDLVSFLVQLRTGRMTQRQLSEACGRSFVAIANLERKNSIASIDTFLSIVNALNLKVEMYYGE